MLRKSDMPFALIISTICWFLIHPSAAQAQGRELSPERLAERIDHAVVEILVNGRMSGSGAIISETGIVATAAHVVTNQNATIEILMFDNQRIPVTVYAKDAGHDVLLLKMDPRAGGYPFLLPSKRPLVTGSRVYMIGTPLFRHRLLFSGTVSKAKPSAEFLNPHYIQVFYIQSASPHGTSGAVWVNGWGHYVGIQSSMLWANKAPQGVAFASPYSAIKDLVDSPRSVQTPTAGFAVEELSEQTPEYLQNVSRGIRGVVIKVVLNESPLDTANIPTDTILTHIDGSIIETRDTFVEIIRSHKPGDLIQATLRNPDGSNERVIEIKLGKLQ
ncbi:MAG: serine protease [Planctomycetaceae bacterium]|jgi:putative serine protease PepD|nr:serine protease [Planctomycetaceae bacterium]